MLKKKFPDDDIAEEDRRIDFLCVRESTNLVVVEIKRPGNKVSDNALEQIFHYVSFVREYVQRTSDPELAIRNVVGYLLCGDLVDTLMVRAKRKAYEDAQVYVRRYGDLLDMVKRIHQEFIERYEQLQERIKT